MQQQKHFILFIFTCNNRNILLYLRCNNRNERSLIFDFASKNAGFKMTDLFRDVITSFEQSLTKAMRRRNSKNLWLWLVAKNEKCKLYNDKNSAFPVINFTNSNSKHIEAVEHQWRDESSYHHAHLWSAQVMRRVVDIGWGVRSPWWHRLLT